MDIEEVVSDVLGVGRGEVVAETGLDRLENWDSFRHIQIIVRLQEVFHVSFSVAEMKRMSSVPAMYTVLREKGAVA